MNRHPFTKKERKNKQVSDLQIGICSNQICININTKKSIPDFP